MRRERKLLIILTSLLLAIGMVGSVLAGGSATRRDFTEAPAAGQTQSEYMVIAFNDPPAASYAGGIPGLQRTRPERGQKLNPHASEVAAYRQHLAGVHQDYRNYLAGKAPQAEVVREYFHAFNGMAIKLNGTRPDTVGGGPGVRAASFSWLYQPTMNVSNGLIGATSLWEQNGSRAESGSGIKVGIIDSGIDETHPFFDCKGAIPHKVYASGVAFDPSNVLVNDHGTHVAGTVAGCVTTLNGAVSGTGSGVAPGAALYDYNVFPGFGAGYVAFGGSAFSHDIIAAIEDSVVDGMDVINMSLGGGVQGPHDSLAEAVDAAADAGVVVAVAAGNSGPGASTVGSPGNAAGALTAGASTNPHFVGIPVTSGGSTFGAALGDFESFGVVTADYTTTIPADGCSAISTDLTGKIALIDRGVCTFGTKIRNAESAGAIGVLIANNVAGDPVGMGADGQGMPSIPAAMVSQNDGNAMKPAGSASIDGTNPQEFITSNADIIAGFSSRGPTPYTYLIKPDLTAPGVNIYSSVFNGEYAFFQGTSMATPHLAGSAALLLQQHPDWSPADVKSALVNTAARVVTDHDLGTSDPGVLTRGGGRADLPAASSTPLTFAPASASFGLYNGNKAADSTLSLTVRNVAASAQSCAVSVTGGGPAGLVSASSSSLSLAPGAAGTLTLTLNGGKAEKTASGDYEGDVTVTCGSRTLQVPWWVRIDRQGKP